VARLIDTRAIAAGATHGSFAFVPPANGSYRVAISDPESGASSEISFWASEWGYGTYGSWAMKDPGRLELEADKDEYAPGETATILVRAPFPGRLLVVV